MLTQEFRELLEYRLTKALADSERPELQRYWCDGVLEPEWAADYRPEYVAKSRRIILRAWMEGIRFKRIPSTHQLHPLHLILGPASLNSYLQGQELLPWIVDGIEPAAVTMDAKAKIPVFIINLP